MFRFQKNDRYTAIAIYTFLVLSCAVLIAVICINLPFLLSLLSRFVNILRPVTFAMAFAYICNPIVRYAERHILSRLHKKPRTSRILALLLTYLFILIIITVLLFMIIPQITNNYQDFSTNIVRYINLLVERVEGWMHETGIFGENGDGIGDLFDPTDISAAISSALAVLTGHIGTISLRLLETTGVIAVGILLSAYILYDKEALLGLCKKIMLALFPRRIYDKTTEALHFADHAFGQFIIGKLIDSFIVGVITFIVLAAVGMPYYPLISAIVCVTSIIPAFGYVIGAIPSILIIFIKDPIMAFWFLVILIIIQQIDGNIIGPKIVGSATGLSAVWVITAIMLIGAYLGPIGWFIGVPLFSVIYRMVGDFVNARLHKKGYPVDLSYYENTPLTKDESSLPAQEEANDEEVDE